MRVATCQAGLQAAGRRDQDPGRRVAQLISCVCGWPVARPGRTGNTQHRQSRGVSLNLNPDYCTARVEARNEAVQAPPGVQEQSVP